MTTYYINLYPKGVSGDAEQPEAFAYDIPRGPVRHGAICVAVDVPETATARVVQDWSAMLGTP